jgi:putative ABC transport system permease protein
MFRNYLKSAWRNLVKNKTFSLINVAGLSIGMAACLLILQYVSFQLSFDHFNKNVSDIYRVVNDRYQNGKLAQHGTITYSAIGKAMQDDFPEVVNHTRVEPFSNEIITYNDKKFGDLQVLAVDNSFLSMFSYPIIAGDKVNGLQNPDCVILTETLARKIFDIKGNDFASLIGKTVVISRDSLPYKITAIAKDAPENSHLSFDLLLSYNSLYSGGNGSWQQADYDFQDSDFWHYIQLKHGTNYKAFEAKLAAFSERHFQGSKVSGSIEKFYLQPLSKAHLYSDFEYEIGNTASATVVWGLLIIALLIIVLAWINYINLSTAKSMERAKEVGVRKVAGASKQQLIKQFLTGSFIINLIALSIAVLIVTLVQSNFNSLIHHQLSLSYLFQKGVNGFNISGALITLIIAGIIISGFYPAFVLSSFKPIIVLKGKFTASRKGIFLRKALVIGQFAITITLIIGSLVVYTQMSFVSKQNLGMNLSQILVIKAPVLTGWDSTFISKENSFKNELEQLPDVKGTSVIDRTPGVEMARAFDVHRTGINTENKLSMRHASIDADFVNVFGVKLLAGRNFINTDFNPDWNKLHNIILNDDAVKQLGFKSDNDAIGKMISLFNRNWDVVGVMNDFHQKSLRYPIEPTLFLPGYGTNNPICVKVDPKDITSTINAIKAKYASFFPGNYFDYYFLDDHFNEQYADDKLFGKVFAIFSGFAIFIACIGLLGLSLFATMQRTKEIGIRKVLGASVSNIILLLSKDFLKLVVVAFVIASPVAWFIMHDWLESYAYRINISWWLFFAAGFLAVMIALATISFQAIKAALANPVKSLRTE